MRFVAAFFLLLAIAILVRFAGNKLVPLLMPQGRRRTIAAGWLGGLLGSLLDSFLWHLGPQVVGVNLIAAFCGAIFVILLVGLAPFIKILLGRI
jgi:uncharacterized membrane protein YeaQ/YmgE (transglycosylase-associated protein family)